MPSSSRSRRFSTPNITARIALAAASAVAVASIVLAAPAQAAATTFYLDCSRSSGGSGTESSPWNSMASANATTFEPGQALLLKAGTTCTGQFIAHGSGAAGSPVRLGSYGSGARPIVDAAGAVGAVILLKDVEQWEVTGLELRNAAASPAYRSGVLAENASGRTLRHLTITNMAINTISGWSGGWYATNAGVGVQTDHTSTTSSYDDIVIADNSFDHVDRIAVAVTPDRDGDGTGLSTNVKIQRNTIRWSGGDDILVVKGQGALIEGNDTAYGGSKSQVVCPPSGQYCNNASASIWMSGSTGTVVQGNSVACFVNESDGQAYDVDWGNRDTLVQYNYSRANRGGQILLMPPINVPGEPTSSVPSDGTVVRYNVSDSDADTTGCPAQPRSQGPRSVVHFAGGIPNRSGSSVAQPVFYNNTYFVPEAVTSAVIGSRSGASAGGSFIFRNNIVAAFGTGGYVSTTGSTYAGNLIYGNHPASEPQSVGTLTADPEFAGPLSAAARATAGAGAFTLRSSSPAISAGIPITGNGGRDYAGRTIAAAPSIGAFEAVAGLVANPGFESGALTPWYPTGSGAVATVSSSGPAQGRYAVSTGPSASGVEQHVTGLAPASTYQLTGRTKVGTAGEGVALGVKNYGGSESFVTSTATSWAPQVVYFTTGAGSTSADVYCYKNSGSAGALCDQISVQPVTVPANLLANPGFESGLTPWSPSGSGTAAAVGAAGTHTGAAGLVTGPVNSGAQQVVTGLTGGASYLLSGWLRAAAGEEISLGVKGMGAAEMYQRVSGGTYAPAGLTFSVAPGSTTATVYCYKNAGAAAGACDDLRLTRVG